MVRQEIEKRSEKAEIFETSSYEGWRVCEEFLSNQLARRPSEQMTSQPEAKSIGVTRQLHGGRGYTRPTDKVKTRPEMASSERWIRGARVRCAAWLELGAKTEGADLKNGSAIPCTPMIAAARKR